MNTKRIALFATVALGGLTLAACGGGSEETPPVATTNFEEAAPVENLDMEVSTEAPAATRIDNASTESEPAPPTLTSDEQTQEDADATGMTARVARDEGGNDSGQPAQ